MSSGSLEAELDRAINRIRKQLQSRCVRSSTAMRKAATKVLSGSRSGKRYRVPGNESYYTASAPGEPPAPRTGDFRKRWMPSAHSYGNTYISRIKSDVTVGKHILGEILEYGTSKMAPRPHHEKIIQQALPKIEKIYNEPYF